MVDNHVLDEASGDGISDRFSQHVTGTDAQKADDDIIGIDA